MSGKEAGNGGKGTKKGRKEGSRKECWKEGNKAGCVCMYICVSMYVHVCIYSLPSDCRFPLSSICERPPLRNVKEGKKDGWME